MRLNVYSQELTDDYRLVQQEANTGLVYSAVRWFMKSAPELHTGVDDDDRSAITIWLPKSPHRREKLARTLEGLATTVRRAPPETGLD